MGRLHSVGDIVRETGEPLHRITYILRTRHIVPVARVGNHRAFSDEQLALIASELQRTKAARQLEAVSA